MAQTKMTEAQAEAALHAALSALQMHESVFRKVLEGRPSSEIKAAAKQAGFLTATAFELAGLPPIPLPVKGATERGE